MIDTVEQTTCKNCGKPVPHIAGHRRREYCNDTCKQTAYRLRKEHHRHGVTIVDDSQELAQYRHLADLFDRAKMEARFMALGEQVQYRSLTTVNVLGGYGYWQDFLRRADNEALHKAIAAAEYFLDGLIALRGDPREQRIAELERDLAEANALIEKLTSKKTSSPLKKSYQERLQRWGEKLDWPALDIHMRIQPGQKNWRVFMINESNDQLIRAIIAAERMEESNRDKS